MAALYFLAGAYHFIKPAFYRPIMPRWLPAHDALIYASGVAEMALAVGLLFPQTRTLAAWGIVLMLVSFFAIHIDMVITPGASRGLPQWALYTRIVVQFGLIYWAWRYTQ